MTSDKNAASLRSFSSVRRHYNALAALNLELKDRRRRCCSLMYERERPVGAQPSMVRRSRAKHLACCAPRFIRLSASHLHNLHLWLLLIYASAVSAWARRKECHLHPACRYIYARATADGLDLHPFRPIWGSQGNLMNWCGRPWSPKPSLSWKIFQTRELANIL